MSISFINNQIKLDDKNEYIFNCTKKRKFKLKHNRIE